MNSRRSSVEAYFEAQNLSQADRVAAMFSDQGEVFNVNMPPVKGKAAIKAFCENLYDRTEQRKFEVLRVAETSDMALAEWRVRMTFRPGEDWPLRAVQRLRSRAPRSEFLRVRARFGFGPLPAGLPRDHDGGSARWRTRQEDVTPHPFRAGGPLEASGNLPYAANSQRRKDRSMLKTFVNGKIHRLRITALQPHYNGSCLIDPALLEASGIEPFEKVEIYGLTSKARIATYVFPGAGRGEFKLNGGAALSLLPWGRSRGGHLPFGGGVHRRRLCDRESGRQHRRRGHPLRVLRDGTPGHMTAD